MLKKIVLKSEDRTSGSVYDGVVPLDSTLTGNYVIESFRITNNIYNITSLNNIFYFTEDVTNIDLTIIPGAYSITDLALQIQTQLNASVDTSNTYSINYNPNTGFYTISRTAGVNNFNLRFSETTNSISGETGFNNVDTISGSTDIVSNIPVDVYKPKTIYMRIEEAINQKSSAIRHRDTGDPTDHWHSSFQFTNNFMFGDYLYYNKHKNDNSTVISLQAESQLTYRFHDHHYNDVDLHSEWEMIIKRQ
jgi:hypothetical protein